MGHARALINIEKVDQQLEVFQRIIREELSVRKVEEIVRLLSGQKLTKPLPPPELDLYGGEIKKVESRLSTYFGTKIQVKSTNQGKGEIKIPFVSVDDLNRILEILNYS
jgi:ParB family chromosome partitioning protein